MNQILVTPGHGYTDIDGLACSIAYAELLQYEGKNASAYCPGACTISIPDEIHHLSELPELRRSPSDQYVIVDTSDHTFLSTHLDISRVIEIYDHHFGYEAYWQDLLGHDAHIEPIGAAATLIWEQWKKRAPIEQISTNTAKLLAYAIVSNTSNFQLGLTDPRDHNALSEILEVADLGADWLDQYFGSVQSALMRDISHAVSGDMKTLPDGTKFGQIEIWDTSILDDTDFESIFGTLGITKYCLNLVNIRDGYSILLCSDPDTRNYLANVFDGVIIGNEVRYRSIHLRKEYMRELQKTH